MDKKRVLITGITGFAGSHLAELLVSKSEFIIFGTHVSDHHLENLANIRELVNLYKVNLLDSEEISRIVAEIQPDVVYHLAASTSVSDSFKNPAEVLTNNITSEVNLLEGIKKNKLFHTRILVISSSHVYGDVPLIDQPIDENVEFKPDNPYAVSKIAQDYLGLSYFLAYKMPIVRLRPFNHIGPRLSPQISISRFAKKIVEIEKGESDPIMKVGNLDSKRDFTDVRDMVKAYFLAANHGIPGESYNLGTGKVYSIKDMLDKLLGLTSATISIEIDKDLFRPSDIMELRCNPDKFKKLTGWNPEIEITQTLQEMLDYWRKV